MWPNKLLSQKRRMDLLCLAIQVVCEVPRWKVPAAAALVKDPVQLERAVSHAESFFREVLAFDPPQGDISKEAKKSANAKLPSHKTALLTAKKKREMDLEEHLSA